MIGALGTLGATAAALAAGAINAVSGGGTLLTFPVLIGLGMPSKVANATSTVALWPGVIGSLWGYRQELRGSGRWGAILTLPSLAGGMIGAILMLATGSQHFNAIAPFLVLGATLLFMSHGLIARRLRSQAASSAIASPEPAPQPARPARLAAYMVFQLVVAVYGGYFGAGIGILMLAALGIMGLKDIHRMNALKAWGAFCINGVAVGIFATHGIVDWPVGLSMAVGGILGGYMGARMARHVGQVVVRRIIVGVGFAATLSLLIPQLLPGSSAFKVSIPRTRSGPASGGVPAVTRNRGAI